MFPAARGAEVKPHMMILTSAVLKTWVLKDFSVFLGHTVLLCTPEAPPGVVAAQSRSETANPQGMLEKGARCKMLSAAPALPP